MISSGVDTFSKSTYQDALNAARNSTTPIYAISLAPSLRDIAVIHGDESPATRIDWNRAVRELFEIARASGGRGYSPSSTVDLSPFYDDAMENLRLRYVITYRSSSQGNPNSPRAVRVELVDPKTGRPLQIVDTNGKIIRTNVIVQDSYTPSRASTAGS
jgi:hypothetical protein